MNIQSTGVPRRRYVSPIAVCNGGIFRFLVGLKLLSKAFRGQAVDLLDS
jgi:hypothetical protein